LLTVAAKRAGRLAGAAGRFPCRYYVPYEQSYDGGRNKREC